MTPSKLNEAREQIARKLQERRAKRETGEALNVQLRAWRERLASIWGVKPIHPR